MEILPQDSIDSETIEGIDNDDIVEDYLYPINRDKIKVMVNSIPISTLMDYIKRGKIELQPYFQRSYVWSNAKAALLIDSIWKGLPIPQFFLLQKEDGKSLVIDGQQRLTSIARFFLSEIDLQSSIGGGIKSNISTENNLKLEVDKNIFYPNIPIGTLMVDFDGLDEIEKDKFESESLSVAIISPIYPLFEGAEKKEELKKLSREIFNRLNTGGVPLTPQEIRQSFYSGKFMAELKNLSFNPSWEKLLPVWNKQFRNEPSYRTELLIRAMAFLESYGDRLATDSIGIDSFSYSKPLNKFLDKYTEKAYDFNDAQITERITLLTTLITRLSTITDDTLFRHFTTDSSRKSNFNIKYIDTLFVGLLNYLRTNELSDTDLIAKIKALKSNDDFIKTHIMIQGGGDVTYTENRVTKGISLIKN